MLPTLLLSALQAAALAPVPDWPAPVVHAERGPFAARIEKTPGQERVRDPLARWQLRVADQELANLGATETEGWTVRFPHAAAPRRYHLVEDGSTFIEVNEHSSSQHPAIRIWTAQGEAARLDLQDLAIPRRATQATPTGWSWLADAEAPTQLAWRATDRGPVLLLLLTCRDGEQRAVDVAYGLPLEEATAALRARLVVAPQPDEQLFESAVVPIVTRTRFPAYIRQGEPLTFQIEGVHPTRGHRFEGFLAAWADVERGTCILRPYSRPPLPGVKVVQTSTPFEASGELQGLPPGRYRFLVAGSDPEQTTASEVEVLPPDQLLRMRRLGGRDALEETRTLFARGVLEIRRPERAPELLAVGPLPARRVRALAPRIAATRSRLVPGPESHAEPRLEFTWWPDGEPEQRAVFDGGRAPATVIELVSILCPPDPPDPGDAGDPGDSDSSH